MCIEVDEFKFYHIAKNIFTSLNFDLNDRQVIPDSTKKDMDNVSDYSDSSFENLKILCGKETKA